MLLALTSLVQQPRLWIHHHHPQFLNHEGCWGTTDDFTINFLHFSLFSTALWDLVNSRPVHSLTLFSHLISCLPCLLPPFTVPWKKVLARPDEQETCPYDCGLRLFTMVRRSSCGPLACWILARTSSFVTWSLYEKRSILRQPPHFHFSYSSLQLCRESIRFKSRQEDGCDKVAHQSYIGTERNTPVVPSWFQFCQCCCRWCYPGEYFSLGTLVRNM